MNLEAMAIEARSEKFKARGHRNRGRSTKGRDAQFEGRKRQRSKRIREEIDAFERAVVEGPIREEEMGSATLPLAA